MVAWRQGKQQILTKKNGLPCDEVSGIIPDNAGNQWLYTRCGLIEIPNEQMQLWWKHPESKLNLRVFDTFDGVQPGLGHFNTSAKTPDGRLWFANGTVLQMIDPAHILENAFPPPVHISSLIADRRAYSLESAIRLPARTRDLEIDYTALSYVTPQKVLFRYMLEGRDARWQEPGTRRQAFYNDLPPGSYRFRVLACNNDGIWNEAGAFLDFSVLPAYYETAWFRALCLVAFFASLWAVHEARIRRLRRQFSIGLEARVAERTRIARELHDTLLQSFHGLLLQFQSASNLFATRPQDAKQELDYAIDQAQQAITEARDAVQGLRASTTETNNLVMALNTLAIELAANHTNPIPPAFDLQVEGTPRDLQPILRDEVCRIASEALRNAFRHAQARRIEVQICYDRHHLRLRVRDDGKGINSQIAANKRRPGHWGLQGMGERAKVIGGHLELRSGVKSGTEIELTIPCSIAYETPAALD